MQRTRPILVLSYSHLIKISTTLHSLLLVLLYMYFSILRKRRKYSQNCETNSKNNIKYYSSRKTRSVYFLI